MSSYGGPPGPPRRGPYDYPPSPYDSHPQYATGYHEYGPPPPHQQHGMAMSPPRSGGPNGPPPPDYWAHQPGPPRRLHPNWHGHEAAGPPPYDHRMGPPHQHQQHPPQQGGYPSYPPQRPPSYPPPPHHASIPPHMRSPHPADGRPYMPDVQQPPQIMRGPRDFPPHVTRTPPRPTMQTLPVTGTPIRNTAQDDGSENQEKKAKSEKDNNDNAAASKASKADGKKGKGKGKGKGDPLSLLAKVCKEANEDDPPQDAPATPAPVPTSPASRRPRPSPVVTPVATPLGKPPLMPHPQISPVDHRAEGGYWAAEATPEHHYPRRYPPPRGPEGGAFPPPSHPNSRQQPPPYGSGPPPPTGYPEWRQESPTPALVEHGSFDSIEGAPPPPSEMGTPYDSRRGPYYGGGPGDYPPQSRQLPPPHMGQRKYPPPRWQSPYPPDPRSGPYPPHHEMGQPPHHSSMEHPPHYGGGNPNQPTPSPYPEGPPQSHPHASRGVYPPPPPHSYGPPPSHHQYPHHQYPGHPMPPRGGPPTPMLRHDGPPPRGPPGMQYAPYTYVQQPHLGDEKTLLRKKFSWKHYPELERFLIANRDDYLKHSSMNYTAEQKQYNNWLTERLLEVAGEHHYAFDPEDFNFVAIRDRIRCYYKSYVQTARKRGLNLPTKNDSIVAAKKKLRLDDDKDGTATAKEAPKSDTKATEENKKEGETKSEEVTESADVTSSNETKEKEESDKTKDKEGVSESPETKDKEEANESEETEEKEASKEKEGEETKDEEVTAESKEKEEEKPSGEAEAKKS